MAPQPLSIFEKALNCPPRPPSKRSPKFTELHPLVAPTMYGGRATGSSARKILSARRLCADEHPALGGPGIRPSGSWNRAQSASDRPTAWYSGTLRLLKCLAEKITVAPEGRTYIASGIWDALGAENHGGAGGQTCTILPTATFATEVAAWRVHHPLGHFFVFCIMGDTGGLWYAHVRPLCL